MVPSFARFKRILLAGTAALALLPSAQPAHAQAQQDGLDQIVVVAQKREEEAQKTPVSMTVVTADQLAGISAQKFNDIQYLTPGLQFEGSSNNQYAAEINLRGQESNQQLLGIDPSVGIYVDGVYETSTIGVSLGNIYGLDHVEVLKGPQGTLYGRNTTGGAINVVTKGPTDTVSADIQQEAGSYGLHTTTADANLPLAPGLAALRVDAQYGDRDGYAKDLTSGRDLGNSETASFRAALKLTPADNIEIMLRGDYLDAFGGGELFQPISVVPGSLGAQSIARAAGVPLAQAPQAYLANGGGQAANLGDKAYNYPESDHFQSSGGSLAASLDLGDVVLKSISAYRNFQHDNNEDLDASAYAILTSRNVQAEDQYTQEVQAAGSALGETLTYVAGFYYYRTAATDNADSLSLGGATPTRYRNHLDDESTAGYGQATYAVTRDLHVTGGIRWTGETKDLLTRNSTGAVCNIPAVNLIGGACAAKFSTSGDNTSWSAGMDYAPSETTLLYFNSARGFKSGGVNERGTATVGSYAAFAPEIATNYEIGAKSDWFDHRFRLNAALYHTDYSDIQKSVTVATPSGATASVTSNAAKATIDGVEIETDLVPMENALLAATVAYTDPNYQAYADVLGDHSDQRFEGVTRWSYGLTGRYAIPLSIGKLTSQIHWYWQSSEELSPGATGFDLAQDHIQGAYGLLDARITLELTDIGAEISVYGRNLTDRRYFTSILDLATNVPARALGVSIGQVGDPRTFGAVLSKHF